MRRLLFLLVCATCAPLAAGRYCNLTNQDGSFRSALDVFSNKAFVGAGSLFQSSFDAAVSLNAQSALNQFKAGYAVNWVDISKSVTERHRALGFIDILFSIAISDSAPVSGYGNGFTNGWTMSGNADDRGTKHIRALCDGVTYDLIDFRFGPSAFKGASNLFNNGAMNGEYVVLRFGVPTAKFQSYNLFIGQNPQPALLFIGTGSSVTNLSNIPVSAGQGYAQAYQAVMYTPVLSNILIPVVSVVSPASQPQWLTSFDFGPRKKYQLPDDGSLSYRWPPTLATPGVPMTFSSRDSFASNVNLTRWEWSFDGTSAGPGTWIDSGGPDITYTFATNGNYYVYLRMTGTYAGNSLTAVNNGKPYDTGVPNDSQVATGSVLWDGLTPGRPDSAPNALPMNVWVLPPPVWISMPDPRPNPFIPSLHGRCVFDFTLQKDASVILSVYNMRGDLVKNLITSDRVYPAGYWSATWDGTDTKGVAAQEGVYYGVLQAGDTKVINKLHLNRIQ